MQSKNRLLAEAAVVAAMIAIIAIGAGGNRVTGLYAGSYASVGVSTDRAAYVEGGTVSIRVSVESAVPSSSVVALSVIRPDGSFSTKYIRTGSDGKLDYDHFLNVGSPEGAYTVGVTAYRNSDAFKGAAAFEVVSNG